MITIYIGGGLANKMFQYAFSLAIKKKDIKYVTIRKHLRQNSLMTK